MAAQVPASRESYPDPVGICCPGCGCSDLRCSDGRPPELVKTWDITKTERKRGYIRRRRVCRNCGRVVNTREIVE